MEGGAQSLGSAGAENNQKALWKRGLGASRGLHSLQQACQAKFKALVRKTGLEGTSDPLRACRLGQGVIGLCRTVCMAGQAGQAGEAEQACQHVLKHCTVWR